MNAKHLAAYQHDVIKAIKQAHKANFIIASDMDWTTRDIN